MSFVHCNECSYYKEFRQQTRKEWYGVKGQCLRFGCVVEKVGQKLPNGCITCPQFVSNESERILNKSW